MRFCEWVARYEKETGESLNVIGANGLYKIEYDAEKGFLLWAKQGETLLVTQTCGDGRHWGKWAVAKARKVGCKLIETATWRNAKSYCRMFGCRVVDQRTTERGTQYKMMKEV